MALDVRTDIVDTGTSRPPRDDRRRILDGMEAAIAESGFRGSTVADVVRHARTSRRTFYEHFQSREDCFLALIADMHKRRVEEVRERVDTRAPWRVQVGQAIDAWVAASEAQPELSRAWIRDAPSLGDPAQRMAGATITWFTDLLRLLVKGAHERGEQCYEPSEATALMLIGGLRELIAAQVDKGAPMGEIREPAIRVIVAVLSDPATGVDAPPSRRP